MRAGMNSLRVLRVELEAPVCSFRYPHFLVGRQLTFEMPPPATIFGHVASAVGEWPDPASFRFAYRFSVTGKGEDLENQQIVIPGSGKFSVDGQTYAKTLDATVQPVRREFLLGVHLTLYLDRLDLAEAFLQPRFPVVLGRSQDLACYTKIEEVTLEQSDRGYFAETILPADFRKRTARGVTVLMPRYVDPPPFRKATFAPFIVLQDWVYCGSPEAGDRFSSRQLLHLQNEPLTLWVDPQSPEKHGVHRAVWFHTFMGKP